MRKKIYILMILLVALAGTQVFGQFDPFDPQNPTVMGQGGSFTANAEGYNAFFHNPAGFARKGDFTLTSINTWAFMDRQIFDLIVKLATEGMPDGGEPAMQTVSSKETTEEDPFASINWEDYGIDPETGEELLRQVEEIETWVSEQSEEDLTTLFEEITENSEVLADIDLENVEGIDDIIEQVDVEDIFTLLDEIEEADPTFPVKSEELKETINAALPGGNIRVGAMAGLGWVGKGIGLGAFFNTEVNLKGENILFAKGKAYNTTTFVGGLGLNFGNLSVGGAVRPSLLSYTVVEPYPIIQSLMFGDGSEEMSVASIFANQIFYGWGLAFDVGALYDLGPLTFGLAVKDLFGTQYDYRKSDFDPFLEAIQQVSLPEGEELTEEEAASAWKVPMKISVGAQFHPNLGFLRYIIDPRVSLDIVDLTGFLHAKEAGENFNALDMIHFGSEVKLLSLLKVRAGYYGGYLSGGLGLKLLFLDVNAAVAGDFDSEGNFSNIGGSIEAAIRF